MEDGLSWSAAEEKCIGKGGHLASILDWYEQAHVFAQAGSDSTWIGLSNVEVSKVKLIHSLLRLPAQLTSQQKGIMGQGAP